VKSSQGPVPLSTAKWRDIPIKASQGPVPLSTAKWIDIDTKPDDKTPDDEDELERTVKIKAFMPPDDYDTVWKLAADNWVGVTEDLDDIGSATRDEYGKIPLPEWGEVLDVLDREPPPQTRLASRQATAYILDGVDRTTRRTPEEQGPFENDYGRAIGGSRTGLRYIACADHFDDSQLFPPLPPAESEPPIEIVEEPIVERGEGTYIDDGEKLDEVWQLAAAAWMPDLLDVPKKAQDTQQVEGWDEIIEALSGEDAERPEPPERDTGSVCLLMATAMSKQHNTGPVREVYDQATRRDELRIRCVSFTGMMGHRLIDITD